MYKKCNKNASIEKFVALKLIDPFGFMADTVRHSVELIVKVISCLPANSSEMEH
jgi:hypothetical protein